MSSQAENEKWINDLTIENEKIKKELSTLRKDIFLYAKMKKDRETYNDDTKYEKTNINSAIPDEQKDNCYIWTQEDLNNALKIFKK